MSDFSLLVRDPIFLATWQVHLLVVTLAAWIGVWMGLSRVTWYYGAIGLYALLLLFIPIAAPEPAWVLLGSVPMLAVCCRLLSPWLVVGKRDAAADERPRTPRWHFGLADLFGLTVLVALVTFLLMRLWPLPRRIDSTGAIIMAGCFLAIGLTVAVGHFQANSKRQLLAATILFALIPAAIALHLAFVDDWLFIADWPQEIPGIFSRWRFDKALIYFLSFCEFSLLLAIGCYLLLPRADSRWPRVQASMRMVTALGVAVVILGLGSVYYHMLRAPSVPQENWPAHDDFPELRALLLRFSQLNPREGTIADVRKNAGPGAAQQLEQLYGKLDELIARDSVIWFDSRNFSGEDDMRTDLAVIQQSRSISRALTAESKAAVDRGEVSEAMHYNMRALRFSAMFGKRGVFLHSLMGVALESIALVNIAKIRNQLSCDDARHVTSYLERLSASGESIDQMLARDAVYADLVGGWRYRVRLAVGRWFGKEHVYDQGPNASFVFARRDCQRALTQTELALRCYHQTHKRWPESLSELLPEYLPSLPLDPYTQKPLAYRVEGERFMLYSVGPNGRDDGGVFGKSDLWLATPAASFDLDLDTWHRGWE